MGGKEEGVMWSGRVGVEVMWNEGGGGEGDEEGNEKKGI